MKKLLIATLLLIGANLAAQIQNPQSNNLSDLQFYIRTNNPSHNAAEGSRYLTDDFLPARINGIQNTQLVRFNVADNIVEVKKSTNEIMALSFTEGYTITIQDGSSRVYQTHSYTDKDGKRQTTFFELLYQEGNFKLFLKENIKFTPAKAAKSGYEPAKPAKFTRGNDTFYISGLESDNKMLTLLPKKRKDFVQIFGEHATVMEKKIKADKLDLKNEDELTILFKAYFKLL